MATDWHIVTSVSLKQRLVDVILSKILKSPFSRSVLFKRTKNFGPVFPIPLDRGIYETKLPTHVSFNFSIFYLLYHFNVSFVALAALSRYQSPVNFRKRKCNGQLYVSSEPLL